VFLRGFHVAPLLAALLLAPPAAGPARAELLEVQVLDDEGRPLEDVPVFLRRVDAGFRTLSRGRAWFGERSNREGVAAFDALDPGQYVVEFRNLAPRGLVPPRDNPYVATPRVTIGAGDGVARAAVELWRGVIVVTRVNVDPGPAGARLHLKEIDHGDEIEAVLQGGEYVEHLLVPGRWELSLEPPRGYLLQDLEVDGRSLGGSRARLELGRDSPVRHVTWHYAAPAALHGTVTWLGEAVGATVIARLVEPGLWIDAAEERGGSVYDSLRAGVDPRDGKFELELPDGLWTVTVEGRWIESAEPEAHEVRLAPGEDRRLDFVVRSDPEGGGKPLRVRVVDPEGERVDAAVVEVWRGDVDPRDSEPAGRGIAQAFGYARIRGVAGDDLRIAAAHPRWVEGRVDPATFDPEEEDPPPVTVRLRPGARVHGFATGEDREPVEGVGLVLERQDDEPAVWIDDEYLLARIATPEGRSDATGHAWIRGVWPGRYKARGKPLGPRTFVRFRDGRRVVEEVELALVDGQDAELELLVLPAASFRGTLACGRAIALPGSASIVAVPAELSPEEHDEQELLDAAALRLDDVPLSGRLRDTFHAGPLEADAYRLALRPTGWDRWTWLPGTERPREAATIQAVLGEPVDLGSVDVDCGPAILVAPLAARDVPLPDLTGARVRGPLGTVVLDDEAREVRRAKVDARRGRVFLRDLPEGEAVLELSLIHPYFLPSPELALVAEGTLERGRTLTLAPPLSGVGGALRLLSSQGVAARITDAAGGRRLVALTGGVAEFPSLVPGPFDAALCGDAECSAVLAEWSGVEVRRLETTVLGHGAE
jgi:protocatechuate 3,4-dioxygenase beta subunit